MEIISNLFSTKVKQQSYHPFHSFALLQLLRKMGLLTHVSLQKSQP